MNITINLARIKNEFIANCPELEINCYGSNKNEAIRRIKDVLHFYMYSAQEFGFDIEDLDSIIIDGIKTNNFKFKNLFSTPSSLN